MKAAKGKATRSLEVDARTAQAGHGPALAAGTRRWSTRRAAALPRGWKLGRGHLRAASALSSHCKRLTRARDLFTNSRALGDKRPQPRAAPPRGLLPLAAPPSPAERRAVRRNVLDPCAGPVANQNRGRNESSQWEAPPARAALSFFSPLPFTLVRKAPVEGPAVRLLGPGSCARDHGAERTRLRWPAFCRHLLAAARRPRGGPGREAVEGGDGTAAGEALRTARGLHRARHEVSPDPSQSSPERWRKEKALRRPRPRLLVLYPQAKWVGFLRVASPNQEARGPCPQVGGPRRWPTKRTRRSGEPSRRPCLLSLLAGGGGDRGDPNPAQPTQPRPALAGAASAGRSPLIAELPCGNRLPPPADRPQTGPLVSSSVKKMLMLT